MQTIRKDHRRDEQRRYLAERRISYGNAVSNCNMRTTQQSIAVIQSYPNQAQLSSQITNHRSRVPLSSALSWQLGRSLHVIESPLGKSLSPIPKELPVPLEPEIKWSSVSEYEELQKQALAKAKWHVAPYHLGKGKTG